MLMVVTLVPRSLSTMCGGDVDEIVGILTVISKKSMALT